MTKEEIEMHMLKQENRKLIAQRLFGWVVAGVSVAAALYCGKKLHDVCAKVDLAVTDISNTTFIDVQDAVVQKAVDKAAQNAAGRAVKATEGLMQRMVETAVRGSVEASKGTLKAAVTDRIAKEVSEIDKSELIEDITDKAKELIAEKFESKLDGIASQFSDNLENMGKIYSAIAEQMKAKTAD